MKRTLLLGALLVALAGCEDPPPADPAADSAPATAGKVTVSEAKALHEAGALFLDVNNEGFRQENGVVPGAVLLASSARYDISATLPSKKDADLVFYCSSRL